MSGILPPSGATPRPAAENKVAETRGSEMRGTDTRGGDHRNAGSREGTHTDSRLGADADRLAALLRRQDRDGGGGGGQDEQRRDEQQGQGEGMLSTADAILAGLGATTSVPPVAESGGTEPVAPVRGAELTELADKIAERVLVGKRADGEQELRVTLNSELFGNTEVSIARRQGALEVRIDTMSQDMQRLLRDNAAEFAGGLSERLGIPVALEVNAAGQADQTDRQGSGDNRRSRGYEQILRYVAGNGS
jgi:type III secretion system needle length determinant